MSMTNSVKSLFAGSNKMERIWLLAKIEYKLRYYESKLGLMWALIKPLMDMLIYFVVFKVIFETDIPSFASYLFIGLIFWNFFLESTGGTIQILSTKKYLYEYSNMNKLEIYISTLMANSIGLFFNFVVFIVFNQLFEKVPFSFTINSLWIIPIYFNVFFLSLGVSLILSNIYIVAKDVAQIWVIFTSFLFFLSPIFYKLSVFQKKLPSFDYGNPIAGIIINSRKIMMDQTPPDFKLMAFDFAYAIFLLFLGLIFLNKLGSKAAEKL